MANRLARSVIEGIRERVVLSDVVGRTVELSAPRGGKRKGLCPFHDEKTPSFTTDDDKNLFYCFGCHEHGDAIDFLMKTEGVSFTAATVELAELLSVPVVFEDGSSADAEAYSMRRRVIDANIAAMAFYTDRLADADAEPARKVLESRGFDVASSVITFNVGYSPRSWADLVEHLRRKGFTDEEIVTADLGVRTDDGQVKDRFRGRLMWPIFNERGDAVGFGGRKLYDEDNGPKYLNTTDTPVYKKSSTLYGLNIARKHIQQHGAVFVVEGYTDVMALHASGIHNVIASSGTAFGPEHIRTLRRIMAPQGAWTGKVVFAFDGDKAGLKAADRAFRNTVNELPGYTFAVGLPGGQDPCDIRQADGDHAVRAVFNTQVPLVQFLLDQVLLGVDNTNIQSQFEALTQAREVLELLAVEPMLQTQYTHYVANRLGIPASDLKVRGRRTAPPPLSEAVAARPAQEAMEHEALKVLVQCPEVSDWAESVEPESFTTPDHRGIARVILAGDLDLESILSRVSTDAGRDYVTRLAVEPLLMADGASRADYGRSALARLLLAAADRRTVELKAQLTGSEDDLEIQRHLANLQAYRRDLLTYV